MRVWIVFGFVVLLAGIFSPGFWQAFYRIAVGIETSRDWRVTCPPGQNLCIAQLELTKGERRATDVDGDFGLLRIRVFVGPGGSQSFNIDLNDDPLPHFRPVAERDEELPYNGIKIAAVSAGGKRFRLTCRNSVCVLPSAAPLVGAMKRGETLVVEPIGRPPIEVAMKLFPKVWDKLSDKLARGDATTMEQAMSEDALGMDPDEARDVAKMKNLLGERTTRGGPWELPP